MDSIIDKLEKRFGRYAIPNISIYIIMGQVAVFSLSIFNKVDAGLLELIPYKILDGEFWRIVTFVFIPSITGVESAGTWNLIGMAFGWYLFHLMSNALEMNWGVFKFNTYLGIFYLLTIAGAFITASPSSNALMLPLIFLSFAYLNPNFEILLFFILPIKMRWIALFGWAVAVFFLLLGVMPIKMQILAMTTTFLLFFGREIKHSIESKKRRIQFEAEAAALREEAFHNCEKCGASDKSHPDLDFRFRGDNEYCSLCLEEIDKSSRPD